MNTQIRLIGTTLMLVAGLGLTHAIAAASAPGKTAHRPSVCQQMGANYTELYTIEEETRSITICQNGTTYSYITIAK